jgi:heme-degrading monooxygenase HmoA
MSLDARHPVFHILWQFDTTGEQAAAFAEAYGPDGPWVAFFRQAEGYRGTELFERTVEPHRFLTLDRWETRAAYEAFRRERATEYAALDAACEALTIRELFLAAWES